MRKFVAMAQARNNWGVGATRRALALAVAMILISGSSTAIAAPGIVVADFEAANELRGAAGALTILVRSHLSTHKRPGKSRAQLAAALPGTGKLIVSASQVATVLKKTGADRLVTGTVKRDGVIFLALTLNIYDAAGKQIHTFVVKGPRSDVSKLAEQAATGAANKLGDEVFPGTPRISVGQLRPFAIAAAGLNAKDTARITQGAHAMRRGVPVRVRAAKEIALAIVDNPAASFESRVLAAMSAGELKVLERLARKGGKEPDAAAIAAAASIHVAIARLDMSAAKRRLERARKLKHNLLGLVRVEYAHQKRDERTRAKALWPLLEPTPYIPALAWIADMAPKAFSATTERLLLKVARAIKATHPGLASALALRAARAGGRLLEAIGLIDINELDSREINSMPSAINQAIAAKMAVGYRLRSEVDARAGKIDLALDNVAKALKLDPTNAAAKAQQAALLKLKGGSDTAAPVKPTATGTDLAKDPTAKKTALVDPSLRALAQELESLFNAFPDLAGRKFRRLALAPLQGSHEPFYKWYQVKPQRLRDGLALALKSAPYNIKVVLSADDHTDPPQASELKLMLSSLNVDAVLLYGLRADGSNARVRLVLYSGSSGEATEFSQSIPGKSVGLIGWNKTFLGILATFGALLLLLLVFRIVRSTGVVQVTMEMDPAMEDEAFAMLITRSETRPKISDVKAHAGKLRREGFTRSRFQATMIGKKTDFDTIPIGRWWVHIYGTYRKGSEFRQVGKEGSKRIRVKRKQTTRTTIDLVPTTTEYHVRVFDGTEAIAGASVWLNAEQKKTLKTPASGSVLIEIPKGTHTLMVLARDMKIEKQIIVKDTKIHTLTVNLEKERRLAQAADGLALDDSDNSDVEILDSSGRAVNTTKAEPKPQPKPSAKAGTHVLPAGSGGPPTTPAGAATAALPAGAIASSLDIGGRVATALGPAGAPSSDSASGLQRYQPTAELGRGAMGVVYKARDVTLERDVALKVMSDEIKEIPAALTMFRQEAKALAALNHSNIVTVFDQGEDRGQMFMVMEFVEGTTLEAELEKHKVLPIKRVLDLGDQICAGLAYAHGKRVIHRDIKPANIFLAADGTVKLGDFGLARVVNELRIRKTEVKGTPLYMSPEQIRGSDIDFRADLYSVGCTLFECVTGQPPFIEGEILYHHLHTEPPKPSSLAANIPPALEAVIMACIAKDKDHRFRSVQAMRDALGRVRV